MFDVSTHVGNFACKCFDENRCGYNNGSSSWNNALIKCHSSSSVPWVLPQLSLWRTLKDLHWRCIVFIFILESKFYLLLFGWVDLKVIWRPMFLAPCADSYCVHILSWATDCGWTCMRGSKPSWRRLVDVFGQAWGGPENHGAKYKYKSKKATDHLSF